MRNLICLLAGAALGSVLALPQSGSASPLATSLVAAGSETALITDHSIQKVHGWHCVRKKGWYRGEKVWHRHRRACYEDYDDEYDDGYYPYRRSPNVYISPTPHIGVHIGSDWD
jgi:hypothetical protein